MKLKFFFKKVRMKLNQKLDLTPLDLYYI